MSESHLRSSLDFYRFRGDVFLSVLLVNTKLPVKARVIDRMWNKCWLFLLPFTLDAFRKSFVRVEKHFDSRFYYSLSVWPFNLAFERFNSKSTSMPVQTRKQIHGICVFETHARLDDDWIGLVGMCDETNDKKLWNWSTQGETPDMTSSVTDNRKGIK